MIKYSNSYTRVWNDTRNICVLASGFGRKHDQAREEPSVLHPERDSPPPREPLS